MGTVIVRQKKDKVSKESFVAFTFCPSYICQPDTAWSHSPERRDWIEELDQIGLWTCLEGWHRRTQSTLESTISRQAVLSCNEGN